MKISNKGHYSWEAEIVLELKFEQTLQFTDYYTAYPPGVSV